VEKHSQASLPKSEFVLTPADVSAVAREAAAKILNLTVSVGWKENRVDNAESRIASVISSVLTNSDLFRAGERAGVEAAAKACDEVAARYDNLHSRLVGSGAIEAGDKARVAEECADSCRALLPAGYRESSQTELKEQNELGAVDSLADGSGMGRCIDMDAIYTEVEEIKNIREWSEDIERDPFAFGEPIDEQRAIKVLIAEIDLLRNKLATLGRQAEPSEIDAALRELREMFPDKGVSASFADHRYIQTGGGAKSGVNSYCTSTVRVAIDASREQAPFKEFGGYNVTLVEAMAAVRRWKEEQEK
jgi:hypothetical protein